MNNIKEFLTSWRKWFVFIVLIVLVAAFSLLSDHFFSLSNFAIIGRQVSMVLIIAFGMTFVITAAQIDLSVGAIAALTGMTATLSLRAGVGVFIASLIGILTGVLLGFINGIITAKLKIPAFLTTLGMMSVARGIALTITNTRTVVVFNEIFPLIWGSGYLLGIPVPILWVLLTFVVSYIVYEKTAFGNYVKATGGNKIAAKFSGIDTEKIIVIVLTISGLVAAIAGLIMAGRLSAGRPSVGRSLNLDAIAAVILGGTSLFGGKGSILGTLVGALIIGVLTNGLIILGLSSSIQTIVKGAIIIAAVSLSEKA